MTYEDIHEVPEHAPNAEVRQQRRVLGHEWERHRGAVGTLDRRLVRTCVRGKHAPNEKLRLRTRGGSEPVQDSVYQHHIGDLPAGLAQGGALT